MKYLFFTIIGFLNLLYAQPENEQLFDILYFKNDSVLSVHIVSVDSFAIYFLDDQQIGLKVVDSLSTNNEAVVAEIQKLFSTAAINRMGGITTISFIHVEFPLNISVSKKRLSNFSGMLYVYKFDSRVNLEFQFSFLVNGINDIMVQIGGSSSLIPGDEEMSILRQTYFGEEYTQINTVQIFAGAGYSATVDDYQFKILLNLGEKRMSVSSLGHEELKVGTIMFISPYMEKNIFNNHLKVSIGSYLYLKNVAPQSKSPIGHINFGVGYTL